LFKLLCFCYCQVFVCSVDVSFLSWFCKKFSWIKPLFLFPFPDTSLPINDVTYYYTLAQISNSLIYLNWLPCSCLPFDIFKFPLMGRQWKDGVLVTRSFRLRRCACSYLPLPFWLSDAFWYPAVKFTSSFRNFRHPLLITAPRWLLRGDVFLPVLGLLFDYSLLVLMEWYVIISSLKDFDFPFLIVFLSLVLSFALLNSLLFGRSLMNGNSLLYKFAVIDRNLFGCCSKDCPAPRAGHNESYSLAASFYLIHVADRKWRSVSIDSVGEGLGIWFPGNVSRRGGDGP
jgi:hypothetical protein